MYFCYIDEAGDTSAIKNRVDTSQPVLAICALFVPAASLHALTRDFLALKRRFYPGLTGVTRHDLDDMRAEVKGASLRRAIRTGGRNARRHAFGFLDGAVDILITAEAQLVAQVWIKPIGGAFKGIPVYAVSVQRCCAHFQSFLESRSAAGVVIADSRNHHSNVPVSHSVFTRLHQQKHPGNLYPRLLEAPVFGHSDNHACLQLADFVCSALLFPMAAQTFCTGHYDANPHVHVDDARIGARYREAIKSLAYRYRSADGRHRGGVTVADGIGARPSSDLFR